MLYTRKGDQGTTKIINSPLRILKSSPVIEALGAVDELNSYLGLCKVKSSDLVVKIKEESFRLADIAQEVQENLFIVQAELAGADKQMTKQKVDRLEYLTDGIEQSLPAISSFFVAGGTELSALFDVARAIARRAERRLVAALAENQVEISAEALRYLNRLSSLFYAIVRAVNHQSKITEQKPTY